MDHPEPAPSLTVVVVVSLLLHGLLMYGLQTGAHAAQPVPRAPIRVTVRELPRPEPAPEPAPAAREPAPEAPVEPAVAQLPRVKPKRPAASEPRSAHEPAPSAQPAAAAEALDFTGVTLTNPSGGFAQVAGNGASMTGPLGASPGAALRGKGRGASTGKGDAQAAELVALGSLSRPPRAPALDRALAENYPRSAHELGMAGEAVVRARILPDGQVGATSVLVASAPEFGRACQRTLAGSRWSAPLDATGRPVATELSYKCVFEVTH